MANMDFYDKHNMVAFLQKPTGSEEFHQIVDFLGVAISVNGQTIAITEASVRRHLQLADADGISSLPDTEIFDQLTLMRYVSNDDKLTFQKGGHTPGSDEGSKKLNELTELCTKLSDKVTSLEDDLKQTKKIYGKALTKLVKKVKHLEAKLKSTTERRKARMVISDDEEDLVLEDTSKQGRMTETEYEEFEIDLNQTDDDLQRRSMIEEIDLGKGFTLQQLTPTKVTQGEEQCQESSEAQLSVLSAAKILADASRERVKTYTRRRSTDSSRDSTAGGLFSTAEEVQGKEQISTDEKVAQKLNDEEMAREEQERIDFEKALELQKQLDEREETDNIDWNTVAEQVQERQSDTIKRYQTLKKKPVSVAQARKNMMIYLKNMAGYKMGYFKGMSYDEIRPIFEEEYNKIQTLFKKTAEVQLKKDLDQQNLTEIYGKVHLWVEKWMRLFEPDKDDVLWKLQRYMYDPLTWRLYGTCEVHHVSSTRGHDIYMLIEKDYPLSTAVMNLMLSRRLQVEEDSGDKLVSWSSKKQDCTSMSSAEAEYVSLSACCAQVLWLRTQLTDYGFHFDKIPIYHFIKEQVEKGIVELFFVGTEYQLADLFTKALSEDRFKYLVRRLGMRCLTPEELEILANESS
ncbi:hypothetical protein Tco_1215224 [Tanacetum coccineum]